MSTAGTLTLRDPGGTGLCFDARFGSGFAVTYDSGAGATAADPVETLLGALAACEAMDVISILRKKWIEVTAYEVGMSGERFPVPPKRFISIELVHRVRGPAVPRAAVVEAVRLSEEKYCSVRHTLDPSLVVRHRIEIAAA